MMMDKETQKEIKKYERKLRLSKEIHDGEVKLNVLKKFLYKSYQENVAVLKHYKTRQKYFELKIKFLKKESISPKDYEWLIRQEIRMKRSERSELVVGGIILGILGVALYVLYLWVW